MPMGANTSDAPWNQRSDDEHEYWCNCTQIMVCRAKAKGYNKEQAQKGFLDEHFSITELLDELRTYVKEDMAMTGATTVKGAFLKRLLDGINLWNCESTDIEAE